MANIEELSLKVAGPKGFIALVILMYKQFNILRAQAGLPLLTQQQVIDAWDAEIDSLPDFEWMQQDDV